MGLLAGWVAYLSYSAAGASLAIVCADFLTILLPQLADYTAPVACMFLLAIIGINLLGVREGGMAQTIGSSVKLILLCAVIGIAFFADPPRPGAFAQAAQENAPALGFFAVIVAYQMVYGAYAGWDSAIVFVEEDKNALTNIPRAMALSIGAVTLVYVLFNMSILWALDLEAIRGSDLPIALVLGNVFGPGGAMGVAVLAIILASTALNANIMGGPRILFGLARDGLFLPVATRVNSGGTPHVAFAFTAALTMMLIFSGGFEFVFRLAGALIIFSFVLYGASLFRLRWTQPDLPRPFRAIGYPVLPALVLLIDTGLLIAFIAADPVSGLTMAGLIALCIPIGLVLHRKGDPSASGGLAYETVP
jgi:APA family basic amino acid/polyamine antiporter